MAAINAIRGLVLTLAFAAAVVEGEEHRTSGHDALPYLDDEHALLQIHTNLSSGRSRDTPVAEHVPWHENEQYADIEAIADSELSAQPSADADALKASVTAIELSDDLKGLPPVALSELGSNDTLEAFTSEAAGLDDVAKNCPECDHDRLNRQIAKAEKRINRSLGLGSVSKRLYRDTIKQIRDMNTTLRDHAIKNYELELKDSKKRLNEVLERKQKAIATATSSADSDAERYLSRANAQISANSLARVVRNNVRRAANQDIAMAANDVIHTLQSDTAEQVSKANKIIDLKQKLYEKRKKLDKAKAQYRLAQSNVHTDKRLENLLRLRLLKLKWQATRSQKQLNFTSAKAKKYDEKFDKAFTGMKGAATNYTLALEALRVTESNAMMQVNQLAANSMNVVSSVAQQAEAKVVTIAKDSEMAPRFRGPFPNVPAQRVLNKTYWS